MSYIKKALARKSSSHLANTSIKLSQLSSPDYYAESRIKRRSSIQKERTRDKSFDSAKSLRKPPHVTRNASIEPKKDPIRLHINLKSLSKQSFSPVSNPLRISLNLLKANEFIDPLVETNIPSAHEYFSNTPKIKQNKVFADLSPNKVDQSYCFTDDLLHRAEQSSEENNNESLIKKRGAYSKEHLESELCKRLSTPKRVVLVPRHEDREPPTSVLVYEGNSIKLYDIKLEDA